MYCPDCHAILSSDYVCPRCGFSLRRGGTGGSTLEQGQEPPRATVDLTRRRSKQPAAHGNGAKVGRLCIGDFTAGASLDNDTLRHYQWLGVKLVMAQGNMIGDSASDDQFRSCFRMVLGALRAPAIKDYARDDVDLVELILKNGAQPSDEDLEKELESSGRSLANAARPDEANASVQVLHLTLFFWLNCMGDEEAPDVAAELQELNRYIGSLESESYGPSAALMTCLLWATDYQGYRQGVRLLCKRRNAS